MKLHSDETSLRLGQRLLKLHTDFPLKSSGEEGRDQEGRGVDGTTGLVQKNVSRSDSYGVRDRVLV